MGSLSDWGRDKSREVSSVSLRDPTGAKSERARRAAAGGRAGIWRTRARGWGGRAKIGRWRHRHDEPTRAMSGTALGRDASAGLSRATKRARDECARHAWQLAIWSGLASGGGRQPPEAGLPSVSLEQRHGRPGGGDVTNQTTHITTQRYDGPDAQAKHSHPLHASRPPASLQRPQQRLYTSANTPHQPSSRTHGKSVVTHLRVLPPADSPALLLHPPQPGILGFGPARLAPADGRELGRGDPVDERATALGPWLVHLACLGGRRERGGWFGVEQRTETRLEERDLGEQPRAVGRE